MRELVAATAGAELHADVADPAVFLSAAGVAVNPAVSGSGVNIKLLEYLFAGTPVVSTGLRASVWRPAWMLVADHAKDFARLAAGRMPCAGAKSAARVTTAALRRRARSVSTTHCHER
jgi:hypothetical protein